MNKIVFKTYKMQPQWNKTAEKIYQYLLKKYEETQEFKELLEAL